MISRRALLKNLYALGVLAAGNPAFALANTGLSEEQIKNLFNRALIIDALTFGYNWDEGELEFLEETNLTGFHATLLNRNTLEGAIGDLQNWQDRIKENPDKFLLATKGEHFTQAHEEGRVAVLLGFQDCRMIGNRRENLNALYALGTRCLQLTYNYRNLLGNGCLERVDAGLSDFGIAAVERMNELGILIDLSHCGDQTTMDGIAFSNQPVAFTHTMCESIYRNHPRAKTDEQIRALADKGGYIGINMIGYFIGPDPGGETDIEDYVDHIDHAVKIAGIDHVGLSSDFPIRGIEPWATRENWYEPRLQFFKPSYEVRWPPWIPQLDSSDRFLNTIRALAKRGYSENEIEKLLGRNRVELFRRVL